MPFKFSFIYLFHFFPLSCNDTCYQMNASSKLGPLSLVVPIYGWLMPFVFILTLISNSLIIMVLSRSVDITSLSPNIHIFTLGPSMFSILFHKVEIYNCSPHHRASMQSATNTVLLGMAACDLATIIIPAPWYHNRTYIIIIYIIMVSDHMS